MKKSLFVVLLSMLVLSTIGYWSMNQVKAAATPVSGYAWSSNIGWIHFDTGSANPVMIDDVTGNWSGYAWSSNVGWLSFNSADTAYCRTIHGGVVANTNLTTGAVVGWARFVAAAGREAEGWDGCLSLSGPSHAVSYNTTTGNFSGYAWGGYVVGWVQFDTSVPVSITPISYVAPVITGTCSVVSSSPSFSPPNQNVSPGTSVTFQANPTSGVSPYEYSWNGAASTSVNQTSVVYAASGSGPNVRIGDSASPVNGYSSLISCPNVTVIQPISNANIKIGRTVATAVGQTLAVNQGNSFAIVWDATLTDDYTATVTVTDSSNNSVSNPGFAGWSNAVVNASATNNGDGTITWDGNTGTTLTAGTSASPLPSGTYRFTIVFNNGVTTQTTTANLRIVETTQTEI